MRQRSYVFSPLDLNHSILQALSFVRAKGEPDHPRFVVTLSPSLPRVEGSAEHLEDVWLNLLLNALDAVRDRADGQITIRTEAGSDPNYVEVVIADNGGGIPPERLESIFQPFFTTKEHGSGLGLPICMDVVLRHRGEIRAASDVGQGTRFHVRLPV